MLNIRRARPDEADGICAFYHDVMDALSGAAYTPGWERDIYPADGDLRAFADRGELYIGEAGGRIACAVALTVSLGEDPCMEIHLLAVHPDFRGMGAGGHLVQFARESAARQELGCIRLDVTDGNLPAERLYASMGFVYVKTRRDCFDDGSWLDFREYEYRI